YVGALGPGIGSEVFQLARLVAAECKRGEVVALDPDIPAQMFGQTRQMVQGGGLGDQLQTGEAGEGGGEHGNLLGAKANHSRAKRHEVTSESDKLLFCIRK